MPDLVKSIQKIEPDVWLVGGAIRDYLLKKPVKDLDFAVQGCASHCAHLAQKLAKKLKVPCFPLDRERGMWRLTLKDCANLDFSPLKNDIQTDLLSRDFSINALALPLKELKSAKLQKDLSFELKIRNKKAVIDFSKGMEDIENKRIRAVSAVNLDEDPLRTLRAFRFSCQLGFDVDKKTLAEIKKRSQKIKSCAGERIKEELMKIFKCGDCSPTVRSMLKSGILSALFPDLEAQKDCAEIYYGKGGVLKHTMTVLERMDLFFRSPARYMPAYKNFSFKQDFIPVLKLAAILHDIAKPATAREINGRLRFFGHEEKGAAMSYRILKDLKFSNEEIKFLCRIIGQHLRIGNIAHSETISQKAMFKIFSDLGDFTPGLIILSWADHASYIPEKKLLDSVNEMKKKPFKIPPKGLPRTGFKKTLRFIQVVNLIAKNYAGRKKDFKTKPLLDGNEIMKLLNLNPGPKVGEVLRRLKFIQFEGKVKTRKEAERYVKSLKV